MLVYLASTSPRRRSLLEAAGIAHVVVEPGPEPVGLDDPLTEARRRARSKACGARVPVPEPGLVVGVDTVVDVDGVEFGKPSDAMEAAAMLGRLQGRRHRVHTAVCVRRHPDSDARVWLDAVTAVVQFDRLDPEQVAAHCRADLWHGKAGGYGIQDPPTARFASVVAGGIDTVIGLPVDLLIELLARAERQGG